MSSPTPADLERAAAIRRQRAKGGDPISYDGALRQAQRESRPNDRLRRKFR